MAQTHTWFATGTDAKAIVEWLREAGAVALARSCPPVIFQQTGASSFFTFRLSDR